MRVLFFLHAPYLGGVERMSLTLLEGLQDACSLTVFSSHPTFTSYLRERGIGVEQVWLGRKIGGQRSFWLAMVLAPVFFFLFWRLLRPYRTPGERVVVVVQTLNQKYLVSPVARLLGMKVVWIDHGPLTSWIRGVPIFAYRVAEKFAHRIVAVSRQTKDNLVAFGVPLQKVLVIYNGLPEGGAPLQSKKLAFPPTQGNPFVFGFLGRLIPEKGPQLLVRALSLLSPEEQDSTLVVFAGSGKGERDLRILSRVLKVEHCVRFVGWQDDVRPFFASIDCFVNPSLYDEGFGLTILEAWRQGVPVIASETGAFPEIITQGENGILVAKQSERSLMQAMLLVKQHPQHAVRLAEQGNHSYHLHFTSERMVEKYLREFVQLVQ